MHTIYLIPGLGTDERLFKNLKFNHPFKTIKWIVPKLNEELSSYALRLTDQIDTNHSFSLIGVSFGGMCVVEISKILKPEHVILISSAKTEDELPFKLKLLRHVPLHKLVNDYMYKKLAYINRNLFGISRIEYSNLFQSMLRNLPEDYLMRAIHTIANWKNQEYPNGIHHIHGDKDSIIPYRNIINPIQIKGGSHIMIMNKAKEINEIINAILK